MTHEEFVRRVELAVEKAEALISSDEYQDPLGWLEDTEVLNELLDELKALLAEEAE